MNGCERVRRRLPIAIGLSLLAAAGCGGERSVRTTGENGGAGSLLIYCGRSEELVGPLIERYRAETGVDVRVRYGRTAELAATLLEEGARSPADVFLAQDSGALGALARAGRLTALPQDLRDRVDARFRDSAGRWIGLSGRARVVVFHPDRIAEADLPRTLEDFARPEWRGRLGWAPANASFQAFVTALRISRGEAFARKWLADIHALRPRVYARNTPLVMAVASGEVDAAFSNHYYVHQIRREQGPGFAARNHWLDGETLVNVAGAGLVASSRRLPEGERFLHFLLGEEAQRYFAHETFEYPLAAEAAPSPLLPPLSSVRTPEMDLGSLADLDETLRLLMDLGIL